MSSATICDRQPGKQITTQTALTCGQDTKRRDAIVYFIRLSFPTVIVLIANLADSRITWETPSGMVRQVS